jgi:hypothetical protein
VITGGEGGGIRKHGEELVDRQILSHKGRGRGVSICSHPPHPGEYRGVIKEVTSVLHVTYHMQLQRSLQCASCIGNLYLTEEGGGCGAKYDDSKKAWVSSTHIFHLRWVLQWIWHLNLRK